VSGSIALYRQPRLATRLVQSVNKKTRNRVRTKSGIDISTQAVTLFFGSSRSADLGNFNKL
jgi:hypothetical protein